MQNSAPKISIVLPTYNERDNLSLLVKLLDKNLANTGYELIVVDDNSPDGTGKLAEELAKKYPIRVIHRKKEGLASAIIEGFSYAKGEIIGKIDADLQHPPERIPDFLEQMTEGTDVVIGSRYIEGGGTEGWPLQRKAISLGARFLAHCLFPSVRKIKDPLSGLFFFRKEVLKNIRFHSLSHHLLLEILIKKRQLKVVEAPYVFKARVRGKSKLTLKEIINYLKLLWKLKEG